MQPMIAVTWIEVTGATLFGLAVLHTFSTKYFEHLAHTQPGHAGLWHLLGEVETGFGFWAFVRLMFMAAALGWGRPPTTLIKAVSSNPCSSSSSW